LYGVADIGVSALEGSPREPVKDVTLEEDGGTAIWQKSALPRLNLQDGPNVLRLHIKRGHYAVHSRRIECQRLSYEVHRYLTTRNQSVEIVTELIEKRPEQGRLHCPLRIGKERGVPAFHLAPWKKRMASLLEIIPAKQIEKAQLRWQLGLSLFLL
jgi:hypothetical protein